MRLKKILSLLLAMTMLFSCVGLTAMAEETISENVAKIGDTPYATLEEAVAAATAGDTITMIADTTVTETITLPAGITFNGNGKSITGNIVAGGNLTFEGHTKVSNFDAGYDKPTITIGEGACLELTGTGRMVIGHGATFNITGTITDAKTANTADLTPSLIIPGASFTGDSVDFNVTNAYIKATAYCSSSKTASGTFDFDINNSVWEQTNKLAFEAQSTAATVNFNLKDSVLTTSSHLVFGVADGNSVIDNSNVNVGNYRQLENRSNLTIKNGSVVYASVQVSSNANNPGTLIVDNATYIATGEFSGVNLGTGKLILKNGATATVPKFGNATVEIGAGCTLNTNYKTDGEFTITAESGYEVKFDNGVYTTVKGPVAKIGDKYYTSFESAVADIKQDGSNTTIEILTDIETSESIKFKYGTGDVIFTADHPVTVKQTSLKTDWDMVDAKDTKFVIDENVTFEIYDNTSGMYLYYGPSIEIKGSVIGGQNWGTLYLFNGDHKVTETGKIGVGRIQTAYNTLEVKGEIDTNYLLVENATFVSDGAKIDAGVIYDNNNGGQRWGASKFVIKNSSKVTTDKLTLSYADSELAIDASSSLAATKIVGAGKIIIDATGMTAGDVSTISGNASGFTGTIEVINNDSLEAKIEDGKIVLVAKPVAYIGEIGYESVQAAINAAQNDETVTISAGEYGAINISNKNITIQGTVGDNGEILTTIKGGNPAITGHSFNGTIRDIKIVDAFKAMYAEPAGNVTVDNVYVTGATYGFHLVAYTTGLTWKIENSYMDLAWANSFGVYGNGDADIIIRGNEFVSTNPYYPDYGALHVNSFSPNVTIEENIFRKNARIYIDKSVTDTSKVKVSKNYHADGVENAFADDADGVTVKIDSYYTGVDENGDLTGLVELPKGSNSYAYTGEVDGYVRVWGEGGGNAKESFVLKLYSEDTLMATTQLNNIGGIIDGDVYVTWNFFYPKSNDAYWTTTWEAGHPNKLAKPTKVELYIDGTLVSTTDAQMNGADGINPVVWEELGGVMAPEVETSVAAIGEKKYSTLAEALTDAKDGDTITLIWKDGDAPIAMNGAVFGKTVTITGDATVDWSKGFLFVGRGGEGNGTVTFDNANLKSASNSSSYGIHVSGREKDTNNKYDGTLTIKDSAIELDYLINRGVINVDNSTLTVKNGFGIAGRPASETESGEAATATINIANESYVKVLNHNGMGVGVASATSEGNGVLNLTDSTFECASFNIDAKLGDFNVYGESTLNIGTLTGKEIDLHHNAVIKDSCVGGEVMLYGKVTFRGDNTFSMLSDYGNAYSTEYAEWIVEKGASVTLTEKARYGLGYGDKVTIYGNLEDALTARETLTEDDISLFTHGLVAMSNWNVANSLTVKDAYVVIGSNNSFGNSPNDTHVGTYDIDFENAVLDASRITFYAAKSKTDFSFKNSDVKVGTFMTRDTDSVFTLNNTKLVSTTTTNGTDEGNYHAGTLNLENSSITYSAPLVMENGTLTLGENSSLTAPTITGTGKIVIDATGMTAGEATNISGNASGFTGTIEVINNDSLEASIDENGNIVLTQAPEVEKFKLALTNATLGNSLAINFFYAKSDIVGTDYVAKIKHTTATGVEEKEIPYTNWVGNGDYIYVPYDGISAKQMGDIVEITICKIDGTAVSETETESLENYAINYFDYYKDDSSMKLWKKAIADMLNYGAAAQTYFGYNADKLVNVAAAVDVAEHESKEVTYAGEYKSYGEGAYATSLNLKDKIELIALFTGVTDGMTAKVEFTNHKKETISYEAELKKNGPYHEVIVDKLVIADINQPVKVTVYNADGSEYAWIQDSINEYLGYIQTTKDANPLFEMASKFATSAYAAMHAKD